MSGEPMGVHRVTLIPGDGIGPEVVAAACEVLDSSGAALEWEKHLIGQAALDAGAREPLPEPVLESILRNGVALKGPVSTKIAGPFPSPNIGLRRALDLFVQTRPVRGFPGVPGAAEDIDLVVIRETTEDLYAGIEYRQGTPWATELGAWIRGHGFDLTPDSGISIKPTSAGAVARVAHFTFAWARANARKRVTVVHKATVMGATDGLFLDTARNIATEYPDIEFDDVLVDNAAMRLVRHPTTFDVLLTGNLYGDILADLAAAVVGGVGLVPGANFGPSAAVFEAAHGTAPKYAGQDRANPVALVLSGALMLRHLGEQEAASRVENAVASVLSEGRATTADLAAHDSRYPAVGTREMTRAIVASLT
jgi:isocitrate dehydrogenase (NAD+)